MASRLVKKCRRCPQKDICIHKQLASEASLSMAAQSTMSLMREIVPIVSWDGSLIRVYKDELTNAIHQELGLNLNNTINKER